MGPAERSDYEMEFWERFDMDRQIHAFGKCARLRLIRIEQRTDSDIVGG